MGFECPLEHVFSFVYRAALTDELTEHELDHVYIGRFDGAPRPDPGEVQEWRAMPVGDLVDDLELNRAAYTVWLPLALDGIRERGVVP
jgi:isopentenyl-diphosphate delta-isomerase